MYTAISVPIRLSGFLCPHITKGKGSDEQKILLEDLTHSRRFHLRLACSLCGKAVRLIWVEDGSCCDLVDLGRLQGKAASVGRARVECIHFIASSELCFGLPKFTGYKSPRTLANMRFVYELQWRT